MSRSRFLLFGFVDDRHCLWRHGPFSPVFVEFFRLDLEKERDGFHVYDTDTTKNEHRARTCCFPCFDVCDLCISIILYCLILTILLCYIVSYICLLYIYMNLNLVFISNIYIFIYLFIIYLYDMIWCSPMFFRDVFFFTLQWDPGDICAVGLEELNALAVGEVNRGFAKAARRSFFEL